MSSGVFEGAYLVFWVDLVLVFTGLELLALLAWRLLRGRGPAVPAFLGQLLAGLWLMLALRLALTQAAGVLILACLAAAGLSHGWDVWWRWVRQPSRER